MTSTSQERKNVMKKELSSVARITCFALISGLAFVVAGYIAYVHIQPFGPAAVRIGVVIADNIYSQGKAYEGFLRKHSLVDKKRRYDISPFYFYGEDDKSLQCAIAALKCWHPDVVVVDGYFATPRVAAAVVDKPIVFIGLDDCVERGLVQSFDRPGGLITGVINGSYDYLAMPAMLLAVKPGARKVLIPYDLADDVGGLVLRDAQQLQALFTQNKVETTIFPLTDMSRALADLRPLMKEHDVLMTLEIDPLESLTVPLVQLCEETQTTLFTGSLGGMAEGAMLSFGGHAQVPGKAAFVLVQKIIEEGIAPGDVPIVLVTGNRQFVINAHKAEKQHMLPVSEQAVRLRMLRYVHSQQYRANLKIVVT
ncbi:MAG: putative tryptophan/tyrosine transport system substrate-binding protein [Candidatus Dependentiae bacterium]|nr:putative tryptophan/tyrosine transport system substrate-binding protein [Candidatus Dependentiae bacterium]